MPNIVDYYELLGLQSSREKASLGPHEVRHAYKRALLSHHPDKQGSKSPGARLTVYDLTTAYKTLSDPTSRAEYDREQKVLAERHGDGGGKLNTSRHTGLETVDLEELHFDDESNTWSKTCRCGGQPAYVVTEAELEKNAESRELVVGCRGCSLWLRVLFSVEE